MCWNSVLRGGRQQWSCGKTLLLAQVLLLSSVGLPLTSAWRPSQPRLRFTFTELVRNGRMVPLPFSAGDLHSIIVDEDSRKLYAATKDHLVSTNLDNISHGLKKLYWPATSDRIEECKMAGKDPELDCANFLRVLHLYNQTHLYVCGTGAFHPRCAYIHTALFDRCVAGGQAYGYTVVYVELDMILRALLRSQGGLYASETPVTENEEEEDM
ncbi:UNVERIFIED_CONTAM: hypothetical protein FKN15_032919 [Acipenser sinensis]